MKNNFRGRDFLTLMDYSKEEIEYFLETAATLKRKQRMREPHDILRGRTYCAVFQKKSTRTRTSFQCGAAQLGIQTFYMATETMQLSRGEPIKDTARVIDRYADGLFIRTFEQKIVEEYAQYMINPVINGLTNLTHPVQLLADLLTIREKKGRLNNLKVCHEGDVYNVCHSWMIAATMFGMDLYIAAPKDYNPDQRIMERAKENAEKTDADLVFTHDINEAVEKADVIYANTWHSMGSEKETEKRRRDFGPFQITTEKMKMAKKDAIFMHPLPCYRGEEITDEVIESKQSVVFDEAENRMHTIKAVLSLVTY